MTAFKKTALLLCSIVLLTSLFSGCGYNAIQVKDEEINNKWAQVENLQQRRADLIPNLVKVVQSYARHERAVFKDIADARARMSGALQSNDPTKVAAADAQMNTALGRLLVVAENYPDLKANEEYIRLMDELAGTENRIAVARMDYNDSVRDYNSYIRQFPDNITANVIHAKPHAYYNPPQETQRAPQINME